MHCTLLLRQRNRLASINHLQPGQSAQIQAHEQLQQLQISSPTNAQNSDDT
jgi:hypothetical protein